MSRKAVNRSSTGWYDVVLYDNGDIRIYGVDDRGDEESVDLDKDLVGSVIALVQDAIELSEDED